MAQQVNKVLAFDQSSRCTGFAYFEDGFLKDFGKFTFTDADFGVRLFRIREKVLELINKYQPTDIAFEDIQFQTSVDGKEEEEESIPENLAVYKKLAEVFGIFQETLAEKNITAHIVSSNTWKSYLGIKGKRRSEQKKNAKQWVVNTFNVEPTQDECDAICIGSYITQKKAIPQEVFDWSK